MKISYSAPLSVVLSGEFSLQYGKPALICAIDKRVRFAIAKDGKKDKEVEELRLYIRNYLEKNKKLKNDQATSYKMQVSREISGPDFQMPLFVAATAAFLEFFSQEVFPKEQVNNIAHSFLNKKNKVIGYETSASCFGGLIYFRKEFGFLKSIFQLPFKIPKNIEDNLYISDASVIDYSAQIADLYNESPEEAEKLLSESEKITKKIAISLMTENKNMFKEAFANQGKISEKIGLTPKILYHEAEKKPNTEFFKLNQETKGLIKINSEI